MCEDGFSHPHIDRFETGACHDVRYSAFEPATNAKSGHPGGALGAADIVTVLYFDIMDINKDNAATLDRDRFVLSKGHASPLLYAVLAEKGIIEDEKEHVPSIYNLRHIFYFTNNFITSILLHV